MNPGKSWYLGVAKRKVSLVSLYPRYIDFYIFVIITNFKNYSEEFSEILKNFENSV